MGQEIERARGLVAALGREGVLVGQRADAAYEAWVARSDDDVPFGLFLIREGHADPRRVRAALRLAAVHGMPHPERFTLERFEDLLMGQLGIEAGILSAKLLQTVRAVQDKKVEEGKLRRLDELLPRAGLDPVQLRILREHLAERVLICPECLARFPRREAGRFEHDCPRCGGRIAAAPVKESELELLPEPVKRQLLASASGNSGVFETLTVAARERRPAAPEKKAPAPAPLLVLIALASLVAVAAGGAWAVRRPTAASPPPSLPPRVRGGETGGGGEPAPPSDATAGVRPPTYEEVRALDRRWAAEGRWAELIEAWRKVEPVAGDAAADVRAAKAERIAQLEARVDHAAAARRALEAARTAPDDAEREMSLARLVADAPLDAAPYDAAAGELRARRSARRAAARDQGLRRLERVRERPAELDPWSARLDQARRAPLMAIEVAGRIADGVLVERLDAEGFALRMPDGDVRAFGWGDDPALGLVVLQRAARDGAPEDRLELLRRALLARDLVTARAALDALGAPPAALDLAALVARAPTSAPPVALAAGRWRLRWSTRAVGHDLVVTRGALTSERGALALSGAGCELSTPAVEVAEGGDGALEVTLRVEAGAGAPFAAVDLTGARGRRSYLVRWDATGWRLEVDLGAGANVLKQGTLPAQAQSVGLRVTQSELAVSLDGVERATAPVAVRYEAATVRVGATEGPLRLTELALEGALSPAWLARGNAALAAAVDEALFRLAEQTAFGGSLELPRLSVEDPQGLAAAGPAWLERHEEARLALLAGDLERAAALLDEVEAQAPRLLAALHLRALVAALQGDPAAALRRLHRALELDEEFAEARALLAFVLASVGRREAALAAAATAEKQRPDLAYTFLAQARATWSARPVDRPLVVEPLLDALRMAQALGPGDLLVRREVLALRRALELEAGLSVRASDGAHAVLAPAALPGGAADLLKTLGALSLRFERGLRRGSPAAPLRAALLPAAAPGPLGPEAAARWDGALGLLLVREGTGLGWDLAHAAARAFAAGAYGAPPPWLELGLAAAIAAPAAGDDPPGFKEVLGDAPPWEADGWRALLAMDREPLERNALARAKAWALVTHAQRQAPTWAVIARLLERAAAGQSAQWPDDAPIDLASLDAQMGPGFRRR